MLNWFSLTVMALCFSLAPPLTPKQSVLPKNVCVLWMQVQSGTSLNPPVYLPADAKCSGACATSSCRPLVVTTTTSGQTIVTTFECLCTSGGGAQDCKARQELTSTDGGSTISSRKMLCAGTCPKTPPDPDNPTNPRPVLACDFFFDGTVPPGAANGEQWIRCKCQEGQSGD